jgi:hypothetical protein
MTSNQVPNSRLTYRFNIHLNWSDSWINFSLNDCDELPEFNVAYDLLDVKFYEPDKKID